MRLPPFDYHAPHTLEELLTLLAQHGPAARVMGGGTDLLRALKTGKVCCEHLIGVKGVQELGGVEFDEIQGLRVGAHAVLADVERHPAVRARYPALAAALDTLATVQVRHKATVAGNLCNASPCADTATPLMAHGARLELVRPSGQREVRVEEFFRGPGRTLLEADEVVTCIRVPPPRARLRTHFSKFSPRSRVDIAMVNLTVAMVLDGDLVEHVELFLGTVAPTPMRALRTEAVLRGQRLDAERIRAAAAAAQAECRPITDMRATKEYKARLVHAMTQRALESLAVVR